jgi:hypothetical protein
MLISVETNVNIGGVFASTKSVHVKCHHAMFQTNHVCTNYYFVPENTRSAEHS